jgi:hypothetical protein
MYGLWAAEPKAAQRIAATELIHKDEERPTDGQPNIKLIDPQKVVLHQYFIWRTENKVHRTEELSKISAP